MPEGRPYVPLVWAVNSSYGAIIAGMTGCTLRIISLDAAFMGYTARGNLCLITEPHPVMAGTTSQLGRFVLPDVVNMASGAVFSILREDNFYIVLETRIIDINRILQFFAHVDTMDTVHDNIDYSDTVCPDIR